MKDARFADLISKIAHELRSPLTSVKGFSATLVKRWDRFSDEQKLQFVETIHEDAERMSRIVSEVLDLARLEAGRLELRPSQVDLSALVPTVLARFTELPGADRVEVDVQDGLRAWADSERLGHVLANLIENAIKFSDEGAISVSAEPSDGGTEITVSDRGVGISEDRLGEIFSGPATGPQRSGPSGSGLGLYLARRLVEAHGGSICAESTPRVGSVFRVFLPARQGES